MGAGGEADGRSEVRGEGSSPASTPSVCSFCMNGVCMCVCVGVCKRERERYE